MCRQVRFLSVPKSVACVSLQAGQGPFLLSYSSHGIFFYLYKRATVYHCPVRSLRAH